ncbi:MAG: DUF4082 domain-containing protein [Hyphomicrobium sp.]|jgi:hypothetical protein
MVMAGRIGSFGAARTASVVPVVAEQTIFDHGTVTFVGSNEPGTAVTLGIVFTASAAGEVRSVGFWKTTDDTANARSVAVYSAAGALLASGASTGESAGPGWQSIDLGSPVSITPLTLYVAAAHFPLGAYPAQAGVFGAPIVRGDVIGESEVGAGGAQGRWKYGALIAYPDGDGGGASYGIDVGFVAN